MPPQASTSHASSVSKPAFASWVSKLRDTSRIDGPGLVRIGQGVVAASEGYRLIPASTALDPDGGTFEFAIQDQNDRPVEAFTPIHEKQLHLIVVNQELTTFHHVHPKLDADGTWSIDLPALDAGSYRAIADFQVEDGPRLALGTDLTVAGTYEPTALAEPTWKTHTDGYEVSLATDARRQRRGHRRSSSSAATASPSPTCRTTSAPRATSSPSAAGDLAYAHVHPVEDADTDAGVVTFDAELTSAGRYGLFFDFKHNGTVHTASFTFDQGPVTGTPDMEM